MIQQCKKIDYLLIEGTVLYRYRIGGSSLLLIDEVVQFILSCYRCTAREFVVFHFVIFFGPLPSSMVPVWICRWFLLLLNLLGWWCSNPSSYSYYLLLLFALWAELCSLSFYNLFQLGISRAWSLRSNKVCFSHLLIVATWNHQCILSEVHTSL